MYELLHRETNAVEDRLVELLRSEENPQAEMVEIENLLFREGYDIPAYRNGISLEEFALTVMEHPLMVELMIEIGTVGRLKRFETAIELIRWLLPKSGHLE